MRILIVKWENTDCVYTLFLMPSVTQFGCWQTIDRIGDPSEVKYKLFNFECIEDGIESQEQIRDLYEDSTDIKERDFSEFDWIKAYQNAIIKRTSL